MKISLIIPAYNEEKCIENTIIKCIDYMSQNFDDYEIITVNDGSNDKTEKILKKYKNFLKIITLFENCGKGYAVKCGIFASSGDFIFFTDADLSYDLSYIKSALPLLSGNDIVIGCRDKSRTNYSFLRKYPSVVFCGIANAFLPSHISDTQCGFKCFTKSAALKIFEKLTLKRFAFDFEIIYIAQKLGLSIGVLDLKMADNVSVNPHIITESANMLFDVLKVKYNDYRHKYE